MQLIVCGPNAAVAELSAGHADAGWIKVDDVASFTHHPDAGAYFNLYENAAAADYSGLSAPIFINAVTDTLKAGETASLIRINGWPGFLQRNVWEAAGNIDDRAKEILSSLNKKLLAVADEPGLVAARVIAMIINEAYFALADEVSSREEIDTAMKLGTNYPFGPFEWAGKIGLEKIARLLQVLSETDKRYLPCPLLLQTANSLPA